MDVQMPEMDGFEATAAIRERERGTGVHTPIVAMTAHAMAGDRERCLAAGMDAYLPKPLRPADLNDTLDALFNADANAAAPPRPIDVDRTMMTESIDEAALLADFCQNPKVLTEVIGVFLTDAPRYLERIRAATASRDAASLAAAAHALKGSVGLFSRGAAYEATRALEQSARASDPSGFGPRLNDVETALDRLYLELEAVRDRLASDSPLFIPSRTRP
jgi:CheY-like chemotaxis protein